MKLADVLARDGKEAALAAADPNAAAEAEKDRQALLDDKGADANQAPSASSSSASASTATDPRHGALGDFGVS